MSTSVEIALGLGSNLGDSVRVLKRAVWLLQTRGLDVHRLSSWYLTEPQDCVPGTPPFTNAALTGAWTGSPQELLDLCQTVERSLGRPFPHSSRESRIVDLDILLFGDLRLDTPELRIPHPRLMERQFALVPLAEIAPEWTIPPDNQTTAQHCARLQTHTAGGPAVRRLDSR